MNSLLTNRAQSAISRPSYGSRTTNHQDVHIKRSATSMDTHQSCTNPFDETPVRRLQSSTSHRSRPITAFRSTTVNEGSMGRKLHADEVKRLLDSLERDDAFIVQVDCLADYQTLVQTIDIRKTPLKHKDLCTLQQRENRIVQQNACRDIRFLSLIEILQRPHVPGEIQQKNSNDGNYSTVSEYPPSDISFDYIK